MSTTLKHESFDNDQIKLQDQKNRFKRFLLEEEGTITTLWYLNKNFMDKQICRWKKETIINENTLTVKITKLNTI